MIKVTWWPQLLSVIKQVHIFNLQMALILLRALSAEVFSIFLDNSNFLTMYKESFHFKPKIMQVKKMFIINQSIFYYSSSSWINIHSFVAYMIIGAWVLGATFWFFVANLAKLSIFRDEIRIHICYFHLCWNFFAQSALQKLKYFVLQKHSNLFSQN